MRHLLPKAALAAAVLILPLVTVPTLVAAPVSAAPFPT